MSTPMAAIVGFGDSWVKGDTPKPPLELASEAVAAAAEDAGLTPEELRGNGLLTSRRPAADFRPQWNNILASYLDLTPKITTEVTFHSIGAVAMLQYASMIVRENIVDYVVCAGADAAASLGPYPHIPDSSGKFSNYTAFAGTMDVHPEFEYPFGIIMPATNGFWARRQMHERGHTEIDFARASVICRDWGVDHPYAQLGHKGRITIEDVLSSRMIASPIRLLNIVPLGPDGVGGAFIVTSVDRAEALADDPIYIRGYGGQSTHEGVNARLNTRYWGDRGNLVDSGLVSAADQAFTMAGLDRSDIDLIETSVTTSNKIPLHVEELGFCNRGEGGQFLEDGKLDPNGGDIAFCTDGGNITGGQPGVATYVPRVIETIRQLRREPLGRQAENVETGVVYGTGGPLATCNAVGILSRRAG